MTNRVAPVRMHIDFPNRGNGVSEDADSAIARPFRRLCEEGIDPGRITFLLAEPAPGGVRLIGSACETVGRRILFFPGSAGRAIESHFSQTPQKPASGIVDHFTFELRDRTMHMAEVAADGSRRVVSSRRRPCLEVAPSFFAWFGFTIRSLQRLELLPERLYMYSEWPPSDAERRFSLFRDRSQVKTLPIPQPREGSFVQANFFIDLDPTRQLRQIRTRAPNGPPQLLERVCQAETIQDTLYSFAALDGTYAVTLDVSICDGQPVNQIGFGF
jgi:hypothetical protein